MWRHRECGADTLCASFLPDFCKKEYILELFLINSFLFDFFYVHLPTCSCEHYILLLNSHSNWYLERVFTSKTNIHWGMRLQCRLHHRILEVVPDLSEIWQACAFFLPKSQCRLVEGKDIYGINLK